LECHAQAAHLPHEVVVDEVGVVPVDSSHSQHQSGHAHESQQRDELPASGVQDTECDQGSDQAENAKYDRGPGIRAALHQLSGLHQGFGEWDGEGKGHEAAEEQ